MTLILPTVGQADWGPLINDALVDLDARVGAGEATGLVADGTTDNTAAFAALVAATPTNGTLTIPPGQYKGNIVITKPMRLVGYGAELIATGLDSNQITIQSSNVTVEGLALTGAGSGTYDIDSHGIYAKAASYAARYVNLTLRGLTFTNNANHCVEIEFAENVNIYDCHASNFARAGFMILSVDGFYLDLWSAETATMPSGVTNAYGVAVSRNSDINIATQPRSTNFIITRGYVKDIAWEGIDTHGGTDGVIQDNEVYHCLVGIAVVSSANESSVSTYAPQRVIVDANTVDAQVTNGTYGAGIVVQGAGTGAGAFVEKAGFCAVTNNNVTNHGTASVSQSAGIQVYLSTGTRVSHNFVDACSVNAIGFWHTNTGGVIANNMLRDFWSSNDTFRPAGVAFVSTHNDNVLVTGNVTIRGAKVDDDITVFRINERGFSSVSGTEVQPVMGVNNWDDVVTRYNDTSQLAETRIEAKVIRFGQNDGSNQKYSFHGVTPASRPTAYTQTSPTPSRTLPAAPTAQQVADVLNSVIDDLQAYGLLQ